MRHCRNRNCRQTCFFILVRFRKEIVVLKGDISPLYHQLALKLEGQTTTQVYMEDFDRSKEPEAKEFLGYGFGGCYCRFCARCVLQKRVDYHKAEYPLAAEVVKNSCYMTGVILSAEMVKTTKDIPQQLTELGEKAGFQIRRWRSEKPEVTMDIP